MRDGRSVLGAILCGGIAAGVLDIADAFIFFGLRSGVPPIRILQSIASGVQGARAYQGGAATATLGLALHFFIALAAAAVYVAASLALPVLVRRPVICGLLYGIAVYFFMNEIVLPLSAFRQGGPPPWPVFLNGVLIHAFGIGLPIAVAAARSEPS